MFANDEEEIQTIEIDGIIYKINPGSLNITPCNDCPVESNDNQIVEEIYDLKGISKTHPFLAFGFVTILFSMAGIPPLAGFFGKWLVFYSAVNANLVFLAIIGVLTSVVGAFYYLRIIKIMYFDENDVSLDVIENKSSMAILGLMLFLTLSFGIFLNWFVETTMGIVSLI